MSWMLRGDIKKQLKRVESLPIEYYSDNNSVHEVIAVLASFDVENLRSLWEKRQNWAFLVDA